MMKKYILALLFIGFSFGFVAAQNEVAASQNGTTVSLNFKENVSISYKLSQFDPVAGEYVSLKEGEINANSDQRTIQYEVVAGGQYQLDYQIIDVDATETSGVWFQLDPLSLLDE